jgi:hypothetical protein
LTRGPQRDPDLIQNPATDALMERQPWKPD